jgi:hypothetical protein
MCRKITEQNKLFSHAYHFLKASKLLLLTYPPSLFAASVGARDVDSVRV